MSRKLLKLSEVRFSRDGLRLIAQPFDVDRRDRRAVDAVLAERYRAALERERSALLSKLPPEQWAQLWPDMLRLYRYEYRRRHRRWLSRPLLLPYDVLMMDGPDCSGTEGTCSDTARCQTCGRRFYKARYVQVFHCSPVCRPPRKSEAKRHPARRCEHCGQFFSGRAGARTCSPKCRVALHRATTKAP